MSNVLDEETRQQILALGRLGWSLRRIERATGVRRETASGYLKAAGLVVQGRGRPRTRPSNPAISAQVSTDSSAEPAAGTGTGCAIPAAGDRPTRAPRASACEPYRELIIEAVGRGRNAMAIWQDLVDDHGFQSAYASVRRFVATLRRQPAVEARAVITTGPGEEGQVDYGDGPMVRDPATGKYRRTRLFVLTLGYSRKSVRLLVHRSTAQVWAELHERAFRRLGGTVRVVVLDYVPGNIVQSIFRLAARRRAAGIGKTLTAPVTEKWIGRKPPRRRWTSMGVALWGDGAGGDLPGRCGQVGDRRRPAAMAARVVVQAAARIADAGRPPRRLREQRKRTWRTSMRES